MTGPAFVSAHVVGEALLHLLQTKHIFATDDQILLLQDGFGDFEKHRLHRRPSATPMRCPDAARSA